MVRVAIIGTGDLAHGLAHLFKNNNTELSGNYLEVTKPGLELEDEFHKTGVKLSNFDDAVNRSDIVVLSIPSYALKGVVSGDAFLNTFEILAIFVLTLYYKNRKLGLLYAFFGVLGLALFTQSPPPARAAVVSARFGASREPAIPPRSNQPRES